MSEEKTATANNSIEERARARKAERSSRSDRRITPGVLLRGVLAVAILLMVPAVFVHNLKTIRADITSSIGYKTWTRSKKIDMGRRILEVSHERNPHDPLNQFRLAFCIISFESGKVSEGQYQNLRGEDLRRALDLFNESMNARQMKQEIFLRKAQTARMIVYLATVLKDPDLALEMARVATQEYFNYRHYQARPNFDTDIFYNDAINSAVNAKSFELAVLFWEDLIAYFDKTEPRDLSTQMEVIQSRRFMGQFPQMMLELRAYLMREPNDKAGLETLQWAVNKAGLGLPAWFILRDLEAAGKLPPAARGAYDALRAAVEGA